MLWVCQNCTTKFAVGLPYCPQCTSTNVREDDGDVPKINLYAGASNADETPPDAAAEAPAEVEAEATGGLNDLTVLELRDRLRDRGLSTSGSKAELVARLEAAYAAEAEVVLQAEETEDA